MNWKKIKEKFPNCYPMIREFTKTYEGNPRFLLNEFVESMGYKGYPMFINSLRKIEIKQNNIISDWLKNHGSEDIDRIVELEIESGINSPLVKCTSTTTLK